jgi:hypothetical protein
MGRVFFFWLANRPPGDVPMSDWWVYLDDISRLGLSFTIICVAVGVFLYWHSARQKKINRPEHVFLPYTPVRSLWAFVFFSGFWEALYSWSTFRERFGAATPGGVETAVWAGVEIGALTLIASYCVALLATPRKFKYRLRRFRRFAASGELGGV